jgi:hypothetical protein
LSTTACPHKVKAILPALAATAIVMHTVEGCIEEVHKEVHKEVLRVWDTETVPWSYQSYWEWI